MNEAERKRVPARVTFDLQLTLPILMRLPPMLSKRQTTSPHPLKPSLQPRSHSIKSPLPLSFLFLLSIPCLPTLFPQTRSSSLLSSCFQYFSLLFLYTFNLFLPPPHPRSVSFTYAYVHTLKHVQQLLKM